MRKSTGILCTKWGTCQVCIKEEAEKDVFLKKRDFSGGKTEFGQTMERGKVREDADENRKGQISGTGGNSSTSREYKNPAAAV